MPEWSMSRVSWPTTVHYVQALYADRSDPFWRLAVDTRDIDALLLSALLHDVGHLAFGHYVEEMEGLVRGRTHVDYALLILDPLRDPGRIRFGDVNREAAKRDREIIERIVSEDWNIGEVDLDNFLQAAGEMLRPKHDPWMPNENVGDADPRLDPSLSDRIKIDILHSIMDSAIDADKLDYLLRDAYHCGIHYTQGIDVDRFFQSLTAIPFFSGRDTHDVAIRRASIAIRNRQGYIASRKYAYRPIPDVFICILASHDSGALTAMLQFLILSYLGELWP